MALKLAPPVDDPHCYCLNPPYFFYPPKYAWCDSSGPRPDFFGVDPWVPTQNPGICRDRYRAMKT